MVISIAFLPLEGISIELGATFRPSNTVAIITALIFIYYFSVSSKASKYYSSSFKFVLNVLIFFFALTLVSNFVFLLEKIDPETWSFFNRRFGDSGLAIFRTSLKPVQALINQVINYSWLLIPVVAIQRNQQVIRLAWAYVISTSIQAVLAIIQFIVYSSTSFNLFPINRGGLIGEGIYTQTATVTLAGKNFLRANGLAGEPGGLALYICFSLGIIFFLLLSQSKGRSKLFGALCIVLQFVALMLTFSTRGYIFIFVGVLIYFLTSGKKLAAGFISIIAVFVLYYLIGDIPSLAEEIFQTRILDRLGFDDFDYVYIALLQDSPIHLLLGVGFGNIHLLMYPYAVTMIPFEIGLITPKLGLFNILATSGIAGAIVLSLLPISLYFRLSIFAKQRGFVWNEFCASVRNVMLYMLVCGVILQINVMGLAWIGIGFAVVQNSLLELELMNRTAYLNLYQET
jgi:hypothetical protein